MVDEWVHLSRVPFAAKARGLRILQDNKAIYQSVENFRNHTLPLGSVQKQHTETEASTLPRIPGCWVRKSVYMPAEQ